MLFHIMTWSIIFHRLNKAHVHYKNRYSRVLGRNVTGILTVWIEHWIQTDKTEQQCS
jgi:hypothetical protein